MAWLTVKANISNGVMKKEANENNGNDSEMKEKPIEMW